MMRSSLRVDLHMVGIASRGLKSQVEQLEVDSFTYPMYMSACQPWRQTSCQEASVSQTDLHCGDST